MLRVRSRCLPARQGSLSGAGAHVTLRSPVWHAHQEPLTRRAALRSAGHKGTTAATRTVRGRRLYARSCWRTPTAKQLAEGPKQRDPVLTVLARHLQAAPKPYVTGVGFGFGGAIRVVPIVVQRVVIVVRPRSPFALRHRRAAWLASKTYSERRGRDRLPLRPSKDGRRDQSRLDPDWDRLKVRHWTHECDLFSGPATTQRPRSTGSPSVSW